MHAFEPNDDLDMEGEIGDEIGDVEAGRESTVSAVELARSAHDSMTSDRVIEDKRDESLLDKEPPSPTMSEPEFEMNQDEDINISNIDFGDDPNSSRPDLGITLDTTANDDESQLVDRDSGIGSLDISGFSVEHDDADDDDDMDSQAPPKKKKKREVGPKRMKKRRKIVIDNNMTELSSDHMKQMLKDTEDIVLQNIVHIADWSEATSSGAANRTGDERQGIVFRHVPCERLLARPCIGDDGGLAPELLNLWGRNTARVDGKAGTTLPFRMRGEKGEEQRGNVAEEMMKGEAQGEEEEDGDAEIARSQQQRDSLGLGVHDLQTEENEDTEVDTVNFSMTQDEDEDDDMDAPFDIQDDPMEAAGPNQDEELARPDSPTGSVDSQRSNFSLGAVNDLESDLFGTQEAGGEEECRQEAGDELVSHTSKWHRNTIKVLAMVKNKMHHDDETKRRSQLSYNSLSAGCSRRTAAGVFFEMLQLKTWDFIELNQDEAYGDIMVAPGLRFEEPPPKASA